MASRRKTTTAGSKRSRRKRKRKVIPGRQARAGDLQVQTYAIGAVPLVNRFLERMQLERFLGEYLPQDDVRTELSTDRALLVLVRNLLICREPMYAVGEWAALHAPDVLDLYHDEVGQLHDDRLGRCLERMFQGAGPDLILAIVGHVVREFGVALDELHNDSTTLSFYGMYAQAAAGVIRLGRAVPAITFGNSKAKRPDLKQLLYTLTISDDGGVPVYFTTHSGNVTDDTTHIQTWDLLCQLTGRRDFLYVADCKLASHANLQHIAARGGRFITVMPKTHGEDKQFRERLRQAPSEVQWSQILTVEKDDQVEDVVSVASEEETTREGFRLLWYHSTSKAVRDEDSRLRAIRRAGEELAALQKRLLGPKTRFRQREKVDQAVEEILQKRSVAAWLKVTIEEQKQPHYRQARPGRPSANTPYVREEKTRFHLQWEMNLEALAEARGDDGVFPLLTNDRELSAKEVLAAYRRQPTIEKRFSQFKTDFEVAPVYLKNAARIGGLLAVYFLVLLVQTLMERELRLKLAASDDPRLPLYPEERSCARPSTRRVLDVMEPIQRHDVQLPGGHEQTVVTKLTPLQRRIVKLLGMSPTSYGH
jgi:transposase